MGLKKKQKEYRFLKLFLSIQQNHNITPFQKAATSLYPSPRSGTRDACAVGRQGGEVPHVKEINARNSLLNPGKTILGLQERSAPYERSPDI